MSENIIELIEKYKLLVSPTVVGGWGAGVFQGATLTQPNVDIEKEWAEGKRGFSGGRYCIPGTWKEADSLELAVLLVVELITG